MFHPGSHAPSSRHPAHNNKIYDRPRPSLHHAPPPKPGHTHQRFLDPAPRTTAGSTSSFHPSTSSSTSTFGSAHRLPTNQHRVAPVNQNISNISSNQSAADVLRPPSAMSFTQQGSVMSQDDRDDASTTTSGSYVISPDDVRLDSHFGKDVIV